MSVILPRSYVEVKYDGFSSIVFQHQGKALGVGHRQTEQGIAYAGKVYRTHTAERVNVSATEFAEMENHSGIDLDQPLDWYAMRDKDGKQFICLALNRSMQHATPIVFALDTGKTKQLYFYVGKAH